MTKGQIFTAINDAVQGNEEYNKHFTKLWEYYGYLKKRLPAELTDKLDRMYLCTMGVESVVMETAFLLGVEKAKQAAEDLIDTAATSKQEVAQNVVNC